MSVGGRWALSIRPRPKLQRAPNAAAQSQDDTAPRLAGAVASMRTLVSVKPPRTQPAGSTRPAATPPPAAAAGAADALSVWQRQRESVWAGIAVRETIEISAADVQQALATAAQTTTAEPTPVWYRRRDLAGILFSLTGHLLLLVLLAWWLLPRKAGDGPLELAGLETGPTVAAADFQSVAAAAAEEMELEAWQNQPWPNPQPTLATPSQNVAAVASTLPSLDFTPVTVDRVAEGGGGLAGRAAARRADLVAQGGGDDATETAVDRGLEWLARHQWPDGGWSFRHPNNRQSRNAGSSASRSAATGLALLCFLGRNHHHLEQSRYQKVVLDGLNFLLQTSKRGDLTQLTEHSMYGQGIATLALAEAWALSEDPQLAPKVQEAVDFIVEAQHPLGGWRYMPGQLGDINVTGWQWLALKTAGLAGAQVPDVTWQRASKFVESQSVSPGAFFTYPGLDATLAQPVPTAIGVLLRMHQGWGPGRDEIAMGVDYLASQRVSNNHIYFNYYTTMVLFHYGGPQWKNWNEELKDFLLNTQSSLGDESGSWFFPHDKTGKEGGRLYNTALAILILEVYYRHLRLYDSTVLIRDFPLEE